MQAAAAAAMGGGGGGGGGGGAAGPPGGPALVEWSPVYSNYFAFSSGTEGSGLDLYRVSRSAPGEAAELLMAARGSLTDQLPAAGQQMDQQQHQLQQHQLQLQQQQHQHQHQQQAVSSACR